VQVAVEGLPPTMADYARQKVGALLGQTHQPILFARVRVTRHCNPAMEGPVVAQANLGVNGRLVRAQVAAPTVTEAVDGLEARLRSRLERIAEHWEARRGRRYHPDPHEWRHGDPPSELRPWFPRPAQERQIIRHKSFTLPRCTTDEAAIEMDELDYPLPPTSQLSHARATAGLRGQRRPAGTSSTGRCSSASSAHAAATAVDGTTKTMDSSTAVQTAADA